MATIQISAMINNSSKIKFSSTKYLILYFSNHLNDIETKSDAEFLVKVPFDTKKPG